MATYDAYAYSRMAGMPYPYTSSATGQMAGNPANGMVAKATMSGYNGLGLPGSCMNTGGIDMMHPAMQAYASKFL